MRWASLVGSAILVGCAPSAAPSAPAEPAVPIAAPPISAGPGPTAAPSASPSSGEATRGRPPIAAGSVPDAGVLYVWGADDGIYRYDGATGTLDPVSARSIVIRETNGGVEVLGRHGSADLLRWDGRVDQGICGHGTVVAVAATGACAYRSSDGALSVRLPGEVAPRVILPADWGAGSVEWSPDGTRLALVRSIPGASLAERLHSALWLLEPDGRLRELHRAAEREAFVFGIRWSPDGRWITVSEQETPSNSLAADGLPVKLVEVASGRVSDLGRTISREWIQWSPSGELAFIRGGGRETWRDKRLVLRAPDGTERNVLLPDDRRVELAPVWTAQGRIAFVHGPSGGTIPDYVQGVGIGHRLGIVSDLRTTVLGLDCPGGSLEGLRPSADGETFLLLCRAPGSSGQLLSLWLWRQGVKGDPVPLVTGLAGVPLEAGGFGYYGRQPSLFTITAWSRAVR